MELHSMGPPLPGEPTHRTRSIILWQDGSEHATDLVLPSRVHLLRDGSPARQQQAVCAIAEVGLLPENRPLIAEANGIPSLSALLTLGVVGTPETAARALANLARDGLLTPDDGCAGTHGTPLEASRAVAEPASGCMVTSQERFATLTHTRATPPSQRCAVGGRR